MTQVLECNDKSTLRSPRDSVPDFENYGESYTDQLKPVTSEE